MAAGNFTLYPIFKKNLESGVHNLATDTIVCTLVGSGYSPNVTETSWANVSAFETSGTGYTAGGQAITGQSLVYYAGGDENTLPAIVAGGAGYPVSSTFNVTVSGGTWSTAAVVNVTTNASGVVTVINSITTQGSYTALPTNPAATSAGNGGSGLTLDMNWGISFDASAVSWANATIQAQYAVLVKRTGSSLAGTDPVIGWVNLNAGGGPLSSTNGTFQVSWNANGIFNLD